MLCQSLRGLVFSLFLIIFSFWCCLPESPLLTFHSEAPLGSWPQLLAFYLFSFWLSLFLSFFSSNRNPFLLGWKFSQALPLIVIHSGFPKVPAFLFMNCHSPSFLVLFCTTGCLRMTHMFFVSCISWYPFRVVSILPQLCCASQGSRAFGSLWGS